MQKYTHFQWQCHLELTSKHIVNFTNDDYENYGSDLVVAHPIGDSLCAVPGEKPKIINQTS